MEDDKCLVLEENKQCNNPPMKDYNFCMFHYDVIETRNSLPSLYEVVEEKMREGVKLGTIHIPHGVYNWSNASIMKSMDQLKKIHGLSCKIYMKNAMVYRPRFQTKEEYQKHLQKRIETIRQKQLQIEEEEEHEVHVIMIVIFALACAIVAILIQNKMTI